MESTIKTVNIFENFKNVGTKSNNSLLNNYFEKKNEIKKYKSLYLKCLVIALLTNIFQYLVTNKYNNELTITQNQKTKEAKIEVQQQIVPTGYHNIKVKLNTKFIANIAEYTLVKIANPKTNDIISKAYIIKKDHELNETIIAVSSKYIGNYIQFSNSELIAIPLKSSLNKGNDSHEINI